jgi:diaminohydroxyphosphoribosylaminopyrimidine deaminase/5-amino-6-(5-phosphoribosylamino)uracil reductase
MGAGGPHAEVVALDAAGERARGATLYCTLEPCTHTGRTGPCAPRVVAAGIRRVVVAIGDPNPEVSGRGIALLRAHDIEVTTGIGRDEAARQHASFFTWIRERRPFVIAKAAASADGFVSGSANAPTRLTCAEANRYFHRQRAEIDAIAVGSGTVIADDPLLTPRGAYRARPLVRVVFDWRGRVPVSARLFSTLSAGPVIMVVADWTRERNAAHFAELQRMGVAVEAFSGRELEPVLARLGARPVVSLLVEGGPALHRAFSEAGLVDRVQYVTTPHVLGSGVPVAPMFMQIPADARTTRLGADHLIEFDVHRTG